ncbi:MAG: UDP-N-acetylmuramate--L-alanine ligase, partial [Acidimicrobiales bacterium]|nr:UDP-N-acetylmuramate--L-alanine ligase [Acidimicrobiales bacterium]
LTRQLTAEDMTIHYTEDVAQLPDDIDLVVYTPAVPASHAELVHLREQGLPVYKRSQVLGVISEGMHTIAIAGTHGKTTTTSMLALIALDAGMSPSLVVGADPNELGVGAVWGDGDVFVVEADESDGTFLELGAEVAIVTNIEPDHLEYYGSYEALLAAFGRFLAEAAGPRIVCADDEVAARVGREVGAVSYGEAEDADYRLVDPVVERNGTTFSVQHDGSDLGRVHLPVPGRHNALNAAAALVTGLELGASFEACRTALERFAGVARRFEFRGEANGITFVDDYAHLPTEVAAALEAASEGAWGRVVCVFQPHRFSRMADLWQDFGPAFDEADLLVVTDIYPAGEAPRPGVSGKLIVNAVLDADPWRALAYLPKRPDLVPYLCSVLRPGDLCLTLGAGDLTSLADEVQAALRS